MQLYPEFAEPFPVIRVYRPFLDREVVFHCAMIECATADQAPAAYKPESGDRVEFAWWDTPRMPELPPVFVS
ncbi:MAG: hypothetical protein WB760_13905 [Xanthobacteraceae bacterium]